MASHSASARWAPSRSPSRQASPARSAPRGPAAATTVASQARRSSGASTVGRTAARPGRPPAGRIPRSARRSSSRTWRRNSARSSPPAARGCLRAASSATGEASGAASWAASSRKLPGGDWSSGTPALSSTRTPQRSSSAATRRPRPRLVVTRAARLPGVSSARRSRRAMRTASAAGSGATSTSIPTAPAASSGRSCLHASVVAAGRNASDHSAMRGAGRAGKAAAGQGRTAARSTPISSRSRFRPNCGWLGPTCCQAASSIPWSRRVQHDLALW